MKFEKLSIKEEFIRLDSAMKLSNMAVTGGHSKIVIQNGEVKVNGEICTMRGKKLRKGDSVEFEGNGIVIE